MQNFACHKELSSIFCLVSDSSSNFQNSVAKFERKAITVFCCSQAPQGHTLCRWEDHITSGDFFSPDIKPVCRVLCGVSNNLRQTNPAQPCFFLQVFLNENETKPNKKPERCPRGLSILYAGSDSTIQKIFSKVSGRFHKSPGGLKGHISLSLREFHYSQQSVTLLQCHHSGG